MVRGGKYVDYQLKVTNYYKIDSGLDEIGAPNPTEDKVASQIHSKDYSGSFATMDNAYDDISNVPQQFYTLNFHMLDLSKPQSRKSGAETDPADVICVPNPAI